MVLKESFNMDMAAVSEVRTVKKKNIIDVLPVGKENAISTEELCRILEVPNKRSLQKIISAERKKGNLILSHHSGGYYTSNDRNEIREFERTLERRAKNTLATLKGVKKYLDQIEGQSSLGDI